MKPRTLKKKRKTTDCFDSTQTKTWNASVAQRVHDEEEREREKLGHDGQEGYDFDGLEEGIAHRLPHLLLLALDAEGNVPGTPAGDYDLPLHALLPPHLQSAPVANETGLDCHTFHLLHEAATLTCHAALHHLHEEGHGYAHATPPALHTHYFDHTNP